MASELTSQEIRARLGYPIVDCDGHLIEFVPHYLEYVHKVGGADFARRYAESLQQGLSWLGGDGLSWDQRRDVRRIRGGWWGMPTKNTRDTATPLLPRLLHERMDELGMDFTVLYPGIGLILPTEADGETRRVTVRALNTYLADAYAEYSDRMTPAAVIPMHTPEEAIDELEHAIGVLGLKAISIPPGVWRPIPALHREHPEAYPEAGWLDCYGLDSAHDYDPVWAKCLELRVAVTSHGGTVPYLPWHGRSISSYVHNHIGTHAHQQSLLCKSLLLGGVARRFPELNFGFLECGVGWACNLYADLIGHWEKRNVEALENLNPANLDRALFAQLLERYGDRPMGGDPQQVAVGLLGKPVDPAEIDEFAALEVSSAEELRERFTSSFYFGCEADDPISAWAFDAKVNPFRARLGAMFSSDIGHWDVPDMSRVVTEVYEMREHELFSDEDLRDFVFVHPLGLHGGVNPSFFDGTVLEEQARALLADAGSL